MDAYPVSCQQGDRRHPHLHFRKDSRRSLTPGVDVPQIDILRLRTLVASEAKCINLLAMTGTAGHGMHNNIPSIFSKLLLDLLSEMGFHPSAVLRGTGVELSAIADLEGRINLDQQIAIYQNAIRVSGKAGLGLLQGQRMGLNYLGIVGYAIQTSANLGQALRTLVNYSSISGALLDFQLEAHGDLHVLSATNISVRGDVRRHVLEEHLVTVDRILKTITGTKFSPTRVTFDYPRPAWAPLYAQIFNCHVDFDMPANAYEFKTSMLDMDVVMSDPVTARACQQKCEEIIGQMSSAGGHVNQIRQLILMLPCRSRNLVSVAAEMNISPRSLRRRLAAEGATFQGLLDEVRLELALQYLKNTKLPVEEIASLLGFSDGASFRHAFGKWTGSPPSSFRATRHAQNTSPPI